VLVLLDIAFKSRAEARGLNILRVYKAVFLPVGRVDTAHVLSVVVVPSRANGRSLCHKIVVVLASERSVLLDAPGVVKDSLVRH